jgi:hypothetical protein
MATDQAVLEADSQRVDQLAGRVDAVIARLDSVVSRLEQLTPDELRALIRRVTTRTGGDAWTGQPGETGRAS